MFEGTIFLVVSNVISFFISIILSMLISIILGAKGFGLYGITFQILTFVSSISAFGFSYAIIRYVSNYKSKNQDEKIIEIFYSSIIFFIITTTAATIILVLSSGLIAFFLNTPEMAGLLLFGVAIPFLINFDSINYHTLLGSKNYKSISILDLTLKVSKPFLTLLFLLIYQDYFSLFAGLILALILRLSFSSYFVNKELKKIDSEKTKNVKKINKNILYPMIKFGSFMLIGYFLSFIEYYFPMSMLTVFETIENAGIYYVVTSFFVFNFIVLFPETFNFVLLTEFSEVDENDQQSKESNRAYKIFTASMKLMVFLSIPLPIFLLSFKELFLFIYRGNEFLIGLSLLPIIAIGINFKLLRSIQGSIFVGLNKLKIMMINGIWQRILFVIFGIILIPNYGVLGASINFLIFWFIVFLSDFIYVLYLFDYKFDSKIFYIPIILYSPIILLNLFVIYFYADIFIIRWSVFLISLIPYVFIYLRLKVISVKEWDRVELNLSKIKSLKWSLPIIRFLRRILKLNST